jgi:hypothetical protein
MSRRKVKDVVDLMRQDPERRLRDVAIPDSDTCRFCDSTILEEGPWHDEECPKYVEYVDDDEQEEDQPFEEDETL